MRKTDRPSWRQRASQRLGRWFPERQLHIRTEGRVAFFRVSKRFQVSSAAVLTVAVAWAAYTSFSYVLHDKIVAAKDHQISNARLAYQSLLSEVAEYQRKFSSITRDLEENHSLMLGLVEKNASLQQNLQSVAKQLQVTESEREAVLTARANLETKLIDIENQMRGMAGRNFSLKDNLNTVESDLQVALSERNQALFDGSRMRREIKKLETRLNDIEHTQESSIQRLTDRTLGYIETVEKVVETAGLDMKRLLKAEGPRANGQGGPFIPAKPDGLPGGRLKADLANLDTHLARWETLQDIVKRMPLSVPLNAYYVTSGFGKRRDPINKRWAAHYGIDLGSTFKSKVYATAPGVVTYAGWKGRYGKLIEISHGAGMKTRYGHLHKIYVKKGQKVTFRQKIGLLGSTGRSTGAHLHYETVFRGKAKNPMKFFKAGQNVFKD